MLWLALAAALEAPPVPVTPGSVGLLVERIRHQDAREQVVDALRDPRPRVRTAAARVIFVKGLMAAPQLWAALKGESDPLAATEEIRALVPLLPPAERAALVEHAMRLGIAREALNAIVRTTGADAVTLLATMTPDPQLLTIIARAVRRRSVEERTRVAEEALARLDARAWQELVSSKLPAEVLLSGVGSKSARIRSATYESYLQSRDLDASTLRARLAGTAEVPGDEEATDAAFLQELLLRRLDTTRPRDPSWPSRLAPLREERPSWVAFASLMTKQERGALKLPDMPRGTTFQPAPHPDQPPMRALGALPTGLLADMMAVAGCKTTGLTLGIAAVTVDEAGRPLRVALGPAGGSTACQRVLQAALALDVSARPTPVPVEEIVVGRLDQEIPTCAEKARPLAREAANAIGGEVQPPKKTRNVAPIYPMSALSSRIQGVVVLEALIDPSGCVAEVEVLQGTNPNLDVHAVAAVSAWRYTPTLLDGVPVPVIMTVTVNFKLN